MATNGEQDFTADTTDDVPPLKMEPEANTSEEPKAENGGDSGDAGTKEESDAAGESKPPAEPEEPFDASKYVDNENFKSIAAHGIDPRVAVECLKAIERAIVTMDDLDERVMELLRGFPVKQGTFITKQISNANLTGVQNKSSFLMSLMRTFRERVRNLGPDLAVATPLIVGPDNEKLQDILNRTAYPLEVTAGQRKYGPPPDWTPPEGVNVNGPGHEVYVGNIPREMFEDELVPLFEEVGKIYDLRLMMDPMTSYTRGYAFLTFCEKATAKAAAEKYNNYEIKKGKKLRCNVSVANTRLFLGNIPKSKSKEEIETELKKLTEGLKDVIVYRNPEDHPARKNRGFCFVEFEDHKSASDAKRKLGQGKIRPFDNELVVDWAEAEEEPDDEVMSTVKVLYVRNLKESVTEEQLTEIFKEYGELEKVKKVKNYAFIHFAERDPAVKAMEALHEKDIEGVKAEISLARPQNRNKRGRGRGQGRGFGRGDRGGGWQDYGRGGGGGGWQSRGRGGMRGRGRGGGYDYGYGGYGDYGYADPYAGYGDPYAGAGGYDYGYGDYGWDGAYGYGGGYGGGYDSGYAGYGGGYDPYGGFRGGGRGGQRGGRGRGRGNGGRGGPYKRKAGEDGGGAPKRANTGE